MTKFLVKVVFWSHMKTLHVCITVNYKHRNMSLRNVVDAKMFDLSDTLIFYTIGFTVRLPDAFRLKILKIFRSSNICYKVKKKRTLKLHIWRKIQENLPAFPS